MMFDMVALAFETDSTRAVSHIPRSEGDEARPSGYLTSSHLSISRTMTHNAQEDDKIAKWREVDAVVFCGVGLFPRQTQVGEGRARDVARPHHGGVGDHQWRAQRAQLDGQLPLFILCGGSALGLKHSLAIFVQKDVPVANNGKTVAERVGMPIPADFQDELATEVVKEHLPATVAASSNT